MKVMKRYRVLVFVMTLLLSLVPLRAQDTLTVSRDTLVVEAMKYLGVPYKWAGKTPKGFDCAGFTRFIYRKFDILLPPSAGAQYKVGVKVSQEDLSVGDLVFYGDRHRHSLVGHVGIVTAVYGDSFEFIHAATSKGICITSSKEAYYRKRYIGARRVAIFSDSFPAELPQPQE
jgi:cell wall-associated NlpC family hydrolase